MGWGGWNSNPRQPESQSAALAFRIGERGDADRTDSIFIFLKQYVALQPGGRCEIRTHGAVAGTPVFKTGALDHSANLPDSRRF
jgi:hypothetical protein